MLTCSVRSGRGGGGGVGGGGGGGLRRAVRVQTSNVNYQFVYFGSSLVPFII